MLPDAPEIGVGLVGFGYWGPNLARNIVKQPNARLISICDLHESRRALASRQYPGSRITDGLSALLDDPAIQVIVVATTVSTHYEICAEAIRRGKDLLVAKPLTHSVEQAEALVAMARHSGSILAVDHTFLYTGSVAKIKQLIDERTIGDVIYMDSVRINLGLFQSDVNVVFDLAPHDLSIVSYLLGQDPIAVRANGVRYGGPNESVAYLHLEFVSGCVAHVHLSWISPVKIRRMIIAGSQKMIVWDELEPTEKIKIYDTSIDIRTDDPDSLRRVQWDYRVGDMLAPKLPHREALDAEVAHFLECVRTRQPPLSDGQLGLRVVRLLKACEESLQSGGQRIEL